MSVADETGPAGEKWINWDILTASFGLCLAKISDELRMMSNSSPVFVYYPHWFRFPLRRLLNSADVSNQRDFTIIPKAAR